MVRTTQPGILAKQGATHDLIVIWHAAFGDLNSFPSLRFECIFAIR